MQTKHQLYYVQYKFIATYLSKSSLTVKLRFRKCLLLLQRLPLLPPLALARVYSEGKCWGKINASSLCASHWTKNRISLCRIAKGLPLSFTTPFQSYIRKFKLSSSVSPPKHVRECAAAAITRAHSKTTRANNFFAVGSKFIIPIIIHTLPLPFYAPTRGFPQ